MHHFAITPAFALLSLALTACAGPSGVSSRLDATGLTVVALEELIVLSRPAPHLSTTARDYLYAGPFEINRMGDLSHYLWLGAASTVDRALAGEARPAAADLALLVDGTPMALSLASCETVLDRPPYEPTIPVYDAFCALASLDQIERIAAAASVEVHVVTATGGPAAYRKWQGEWSQWSAFVARAGPRAAAHPVAETSKRRR